MLVYRTIFNETWKTTFKSLHSTDLTLKFYGPTFYGKCKLGGNQNYYT